MIRVLFWGFGKKVDSKMGNRIVEEKGETKKLKAEGGKPAPPRGKGGTFG